MYIGIDIGHTNVKAVAFDGDWTVAGEVGVEGGMVHPSANRTEISIEHRWEIVIDCLDQLETLVDPTDGFDGIGFAGGGGGLYPLDVDGEPFMNGIPLLDERAMDLYTRWQEDGTYQQICTITGTPTPAGGALMVLRWLKDNAPQQYETIEHILNLKDIVRYKLTGEPALEPSDATFSFTNHRTQRYDDELLELAGVPEMQQTLPELKTASYDLAGTTTREIERLTGIEAGTPVVAGAHDACANTLGVGGIEEDIVTTAGGTWSLSTMPIDEPIVEIDNWCCENFLERGTWMLEIAMPTGTISLNWFVEEFCQPERRQAERENRAIWDVIEETIADVDTDVLFYPFLFGNPYGYLYDENAAGTFIGMGSTDGREEMLRAVYEAIAFIHRWQIELIDEAVGVEEVRFTGGAARSDFWAGLFADVLEMPVTTTAIEESGCFGAAMLAAIGVGELDSLEATSDLVEIEDVYHPSGEQYSDAYATFRKLETLLEEPWLAQKQ